MARDRAEPDTALRRPVPRLSVPVAPYLGQPDDDELPLLLAYLRSLARLDDVRRVEKRAWRLRRRPQA